MEQKKEEFQKVWVKIVAKAWSDQEFKGRLMEDPQSVLKSHGVEVPSGVRLVVNESTEDMCYLTLPAKPAGELSEEKLQSIAAGFQQMPSLGPNGFPLVWS